MKKFLIVISIMAIVIAASAGITNALNGNNVSDTDRFTIVTSFYPTYIATKNLADGIDGVKVVNLTENHQGCLHDYQLTTNDMKKLEGADVFVMNGGGMEGFIEDVVEKYPELTVVDASKNIAFLKPVEGHHHEHSEGIEEHEHEEGGVHEHSHEINAHVWMDPVRYEMQVRNIANGLIKVDTTHKNLYEDNEREYLKQVENIKMQLDNLKVDKKPQIITFHEAFAYLADYLGYEVVYCMDLDEESGLSAGEIAEVIDEIKEHDVKVLFTETQYENSIATNISTETKAKVYVLSSLTSAKDGISAYIEGMQKNINVLKGVFIQ